MPKEQLFETPTVAGLAEFIREHQPKPVTKGDFRFVVPIQRGAPGRRPLFIVAGGWGGEIELFVYAEFARLLDPQQPIYGLKARGAGTNERPHRTATEMASDYLEEVRAIQPYGPYWLAGEYVGGICAHEMACQLREAGEQVAQLILLNTRVPSPMNWLFLSAKVRSGPRKRSGTFSDACAAIGKDVWVVVGQKGAISLQQIRSRSVAPVRNPCRRIREGGGIPTDFDGTSAAQVCRSVTVIVDRTRCLGQPLGNCSGRRTGSARFAGDQISAFGNKNAAQKLREILRNPFSRMILPPPTWSIGPQEPMLQPERSILGVFAS